MLSTGAAWPCSRPCAHAPPPQIGLGAGSSPPRDWNTSNATNCRMALRCGSLPPIFLPSSSTCAALERNAALAHESGLILLVPGAVGDEDEVGTKLRRCENRERSVKGGVGKRATITHLSNDRPLDGTNRCAPANLVEGGYLCRGARHNGG